MSKLRPTRKVPESVANERHQTCVHSEACDRLHSMHRSDASFWDNEEFWLKCDQCKEYDSQHCPMSWSGTMRCMGSRKKERE